MKAVITPARLIYNHGTGEIVVHLPNCVHVNFSVNNSVGLFKFLDVYESGRLEKISRSSKRLYRDAILKAKIKPSREMAASLEKLVASMTAEEANKLLARLKERMQ